MLLWVSIYSGPLWTLVISHKISNIKQGGYTLYNMHYVAHYISMQPLICLFFIASSLDYKTRLLYYI